MKNIKKQSLSLPVTNFFLKSVLVLILLGGILCSGSVCGDPIVSKLDELISVYHNNGEFNGCILVAQNGEILFEKAYGYSDHTASKLLTTDYQFRLASVSKQFTAMAIMILKERNKLQYDDPVVKYLKDFPYKNVTIRHLLTHTSGLAEYGELFDKERAAGGMRKQVVSNRDVYDLILKYAPPLQFVPGDKHEYSNTGYVILALLTEAVSGQSFQSFAAENIFIPSGMSNSYVNPPDGQLKDEFRAKGFTIASDGSGYVPGDWNYQNGMYGDGGVISTVHDLLLWDRALRSGTLVEKSTLDEAFTQVKLTDGSAREYGFGWYVIKQDSGIVVAHGGGWLGYSTGIMRDLSTGQTVIQLCNMPSRRLFFTLWDMLNGRDISPPEYVQVSFKLSSDQLADTDSVFIAGNHKKLGNWDPARTKFEKISEHEWQRTLSLEKGYNIEYKITRGSWEAEALYEKGVIPGNEVFTVTADTLIEIHVPCWKDRAE